MTSDNKTSSQETSVVPDVWDGGSDGSQKANLQTDEAAVSEILPKLTRSHVPKDHFVEALEGINVASSRGISGSQSTALVLANAKGSAQEIAELRQRCSELELKNETLIDDKSDLRVELSEERGKNTLLTTTSRMSGIFFVVGSVMVSFAFLPAGQELTGRQTFTLIIAAVFYVIGFVAPYLFGEK